MELKDRIRNRREELGLSQTELAKRLGYKDKTAISKIETGQNDISIPKLEAFASALDTTPTALMGLDEQEQQEAQAAQPLTPSEQQMIDLLRKIPADQLPTVQALLKALAERG